MLKLILILSLLFNATLVFGLYRTAGDYDRLLLWACEQGNGGFECGEE